MNWDLIMFYALVVGTCVLLFGVGGYAISHGAADQRVRIVNMDRCP